MKTAFVARVSVGIAALFAMPGVALAQWVPGSEVAGQGLQVTTNGVTNTVYLDPGGAARIVTPGGNVVNGTWTAANGQLCLGSGAAQECFPYGSPFQAGQPMTLTSSCGQSATWLASSTNAPPTQRSGGERGR